MKRIITLVTVLLVMTGCSKPKTAAESITAGTYDWSTAQVTCANDISNVLSVIFAGDVNSYAQTRTEWLPRVKPEAQGAMLPSTNPPQGCSATITYMGYSGTEYNSDKAEYLAYTAFVLNNTTLEKVNYNLIVKLERGKEGYVIGGFSKELQTPTK